MREDDRIYYENHTLERIIEEILEEADGLRKVWEDKGPSAELYVYCTTLHLKAQSAINEIDATTDKLPTGPMEAEDWHANGMALIQLVRYEEAVEAFYQAIALRPDYAEAWYNKGTVLIWLERYSEGREAQERAIAIKPELARTRDDNGIAQGLSERYSEASEIHEQIIRSDDQLRWIPLNEAAQRLGMSPVTLRLQARKGRLPAVRFGRDWFTTPLWVETYRDTVQRQPAKAG